MPHIRSIDEPADLEEERRLFYVGMTRAKKALYLCHANERMIRGSYSYNVASRFLNEIPDEYLNRLSSVHKAGTHGDGFSQIVPDEYEGDGFRIGQRVIHPIFGEGIIKKTEGQAGQQKLFVQFRGGGLKHLSAAHANLTAIT